MFGVYYQGTRRHRRVAEQTQRRQGRLAEQPRERAPPSRRMAGGVARAPARASAPSRRRRAAGRATPPSSRCSALVPSFEWSRQAADGSTITEQAPLFGDLIDAVKWYADRKEGDAGEPPDFAPGTNARRRAALKTPPTRHGRSRLLSAMSFRSTRSLAAASVGSGSSRSAASSRKVLPRLSRPHPPSLLWT